MAYLSPGKGVPDKGKGSKLSAKMERFVEEYLIDLNATQAVVRAGYKTKNPNRLGTELLRHPLVREKIDVAMEDKKERAELQADYLINKLINIIDRTETSNPQACLRAIELAGKSIALWKERQEISGPDGGAIETEQRVKEDAANFARNLSRLIKRGGEGEVLEFPKRTGESGT